ncbi:unnamed protein product, partial [Polarella glacialis]
ARGIGYGAPFKKTRFRTCGSRHHLYPGFATGPAEAAELHQSSRRGDKCRAARHVNGTRFRHRQQRSNSR